jgi:heme/copper-type cytochrome/quinol oxidase subunit 2
MNKYFIMLLLTGVILGGGVFYRTFVLSEEDAPVETGVVRNVRVMALKNQWIFKPEVVEVDQGDRIIMEIVNEDAYDHGIAIDAYGISQRMPANQTVVIEFVATQEGDFPLYCSVPCGEGYVDDELRDHFDMIGKLHVRSLISETQ